jgi:arginyl-tRNA synthetase
MTPLQTLQDRLRTALTGFVEDPAPYVAMVKPTQDPKHGDYQANCAMPLAKVWNVKPRDAAQRIVDRIPLDNVLEQPEIAGPGFINLRLKDEWLAARAREMAPGDHLGIAPVSAPRTFVIDFSSPNVAKPMHVGHLRSTIIGDALTRLLRFLGHKVISDNHLGDWGEQFGILLYGYKHFCDQESLQKDPVRELARIYVHVRSLMKKSDEEDGDDAPDPIADAARLETARLHAGDPENVRLWQMFMPWCLEEIDRIYRRLDVHFDHTHGESFYNPMLPGVVESLKQKNLAELSRGALVVFVREGEPPAKVQKPDGAFTYTATDLATIRYRVDTWHPQAMLYVVDFRQSGHFKNLFEIARRWGYGNVEYEHISFGAMLGADRKPLQTRKGGNTELTALLDEAVARARDVFEQLQKEAQERGEEVPDFSPEELRSIHEVVGTGAVKYADLLQNRTTDYVFDLNKMVATDGNTATYMQYAYARNRSIFRKGNEDPERFRKQPPAVRLEHPNERALSLQLLRFGEALQAAAEEYKPNVITAYLWDLAKAYSGFFTNCPVLKAPEPSLRESRLLLCDLTARVIQRGLDLLGIRTVERM